MQTQVETDGNSEVLNLIQLRRRAQEKQQLREQLPENDHHTKDDNVADQIFIERNGKISSIKKLLS